MLLSPYQGILLLLWSLIYLRSVKCATKKGCYNLRSVYVCGFVSRPLHRKFFSFGEFARFFLNVHSTKRGNNVEIKQLQSVIKIKAKNYLGLFSLTHRVRRLMNKGQIDDLFKHFRRAKWGKTYKTMAVRRWKIFGCGRGIANLKMLFKCNSFYIVEL